MGTPADLANLPPPADRTKGWQPDPAANSEGLRWWNGERWFDDTREGSDHQSQSVIYGQNLTMTTSNVIDGTVVAEYLGIVTGQAVLGVNVFRDFAAGVRNVVGGRSASYEKQLRVGVSQVLAELEATAMALGADAVIAVDVDYETIADAMLIIGASGTAVKLGVGGP